MSTITIGIDPHKASHTAVAVDEFETVVDEIRIRSCPTQAVLLRQWADGFRDIRVWAVESAQGLGYLLSQQLIAAGETVIDVPAVRASRVRTLSTGRSQKNDPTMPARSRPLRFAPPIWPRYCPTTTPGSCACWPHAITTPAGRRTASAAGCTRCCQRCSPVALTTGCHR